MKVSHDRLQRWLNNSVTQAVLVAVKKHKEQYANEMAAGKCVGRSSFSIEQAYMHSVGCCYMLDKMSSPADLLEMYDLVEKEPDNEDDKKDERQEY